ncbi:MAG: TaqI-like C-terminal specificity domain-containing protein [Oscillospiraceae bacterium]
MIAKRIALTESISSTESFCSLRELCAELAISDATARNWIRLGKLLPEYMEEDMPYFSRSYVQSIKDEIRSGKNKALKSRRNKKFISGNAIYKNYISGESSNINVLKFLFSIIEEKNIKLSLDELQILIADCALHLIADREGTIITDPDTFDPRSLLAKYLEGNISFNRYDCFIDDLISDKRAAKDLLDKYPTLFHLEYKYEPSNDILGMLYISCRNLHARKATGSYYTPRVLVNQLILQLNFSSNASILDPCCGTGNFLLQLPEFLHFGNIYGYDIDGISIKITRINMALKYPSAPSDMIYEHIRQCDFLTSNSGKHFDYIIGNPPWGYDFTEGEKNFLRYNYYSASGKNIEAYDVFIEKALACLAENGKLAFIIPEAFLNAKTHMPIRKIIMECSSIRHLTFLGNAFHGVNCPCIILQLVYNRKPFSTIGMQVKDEDQSFTIAKNRPVFADYFSFTANDSEYAILEKIKSLENICYLKNHATFALGIVTGNNKKFISNKKTAENEQILRGADVYKYHFAETDTFITYKPERFQQTAPEKVYRAKEKLLYRFISSQLVFAYDDRQTLSLNSCNIIIPELPSLKTKYVLAILNSRAAQFFFQKEFRSIKVLRSHIESIPIPAADTKMQDKIINMTNKLISGLPPHEAMEIYNELDSMISEIFCLSETEKNVICKAIDTNRSFLY